MRPIVRTLLFISAGAALIAAAGCSGNGAAQPQEAGRPPVAVAVTPVASADLVEGVDVVGSLAPKFSADVKSEVTGIVTEVYVTEWVPVKRGRAAGAARQPRDRGGHRGAEGDRGAGEGGRDARAAASSTGRSSSSSTASSRRRTSTRRRRPSRRPRRRMSAARAQIKTAETRLAKSLIPSPMDGVVALRGVSVGDRVENMGGDAPLFRIVDNRVLDLTVSVPSSRIASVRVGQPLEFTTDALPGRTFTGKVTFINPAIDPASRSAKVDRRGAQPRRRSSRAASFAKGRIVRGDAAGRAAGAARGAPQLGRRAADGRGVRGAGRPGARSGAVKTGSVERRHGRGRVGAVGRRTGRDPRRVRPARGRPRRGRHRRGGVAHVPLQPVHQAAGLRHRDDAHAGDARPLLVPPAANRHDAGRRDPGAVDHDRVPGRLARDGRARGDAARSRRRSTRSPGVKHVASISREGLSSVIVEFNLEVKINDASQEARAKINAIAARAARRDRGADHPEARLRGDAGHLAGGPLHDARPARADDAGRPEDQAAAREHPGRRQGQAGRHPPTREVAVNLDPTRLAALGMGVDEVVAGLASENVNTPLGRLTAGGTEMPLRISGKPRTVEEYRAMVIGRRARRSRSRSATWRPSTTASRSSGRWRSSTASRRWPSTSSSSPRRTPSASWTRSCGGRRSCGRSCRPGPRSRSCATPRSFIRESVADVKNTLLLGGLLTILIVFLLPQLLALDGHHRPDAAHLGHLLVHRHVLPRDDAEHDDADGAVAGHRPADRRRDRRAGEHRPAPRARARTTSRRRARARPRSAWRCSPPRCRSSRCSSRWPS